MQSRIEPDQVLVDIADYVANYRIRSEQAIDAARLCMTDTVACALDALDYPECARLVGPVVPGTIVPHGARIPGTRYELDPEAAAFSLGCMIRWLEYNDTFTAAQGSHPSDNLAGILMLADHLSRQRVAIGRDPLLVRDVLENLVKAYEIQGCLAIENAFSRTAMVDHNLLPRVASSALLTHMLGGSRAHIISAVSNAFIDCSLPVYRHAPNVGQRKSWACADAIAQAMRLSRMVIGGEAGYPSVLTAAREGFYDARCDGKPFKFQRPYGEYVIQHSNFKLVPAGMHGQTPAECAFQLHPLVRNRLYDIERIDVRCTKALMLGMHKTGSLRTPAVRDECAQYIIAVGLIQGELKTHNYEDDYAADPRIDKLRDKMVLTEDVSYTARFYDPAKRSTASSIQIRFTDGSSTPKVEIEYPAGHPRRRAEALPVLRAKFAASLAHRYSQETQLRILELCDDPPRLYRTPTNEFVDMLVTAPA